MLLNMIFSLLAAAFVIYQISPPQELPQIIMIIIGAVNSAVVQFVKKAFNERWARFLVALLLSVIVGIISFFVVDPQGLDLVDSVVYVYAFASIAHRLWWSPIWQKKSS